MKKDALKDGTREYAQAVVQAREEAASVELPRSTQQSAGYGSLVGSGSLVYYLGTNTDVLTTGATLTEVPLYAAFAGMSVLASNSLESICGKSDTRTITDSTISGAAMGAGGAGVIVAIAFGVVGDVVTLGGFSLAGALFGYWKSRKGRKEHNCGQKLECNTWICSRCLNVVCPIDPSDKESWDVLDTVEYLQLKWNFNSLQAIAFLRFAELLDKAEVFEEFPATWEPAIVQAAAKK